MHIGKNVVNMHTTKYYSSEISLKKNRSSLFHFSVNACGLVLHPYKCEYAFPYALGAIVLREWTILGRARINCLDI